ncbi:MAG TPA: HNH endonuclease signature motif containing protein [Candidatus Dormibacteraeota bacterium]|nr:HNH endonuclease signature motif containing protein [Candidatus Dormibacteraeota bacterium]
MRQEFLRQDGLTRTPPGCQVDHIVPLAKGGTDSVGNLQLLCGPALKTKEARELRQLTPPGTHRRARRDREPLTLLWCGACTAPTGRKGGSGATISVVMSMGELRQHSSRACCYSRVCHFRHKA